MIVYNSRLAQFVTVVRGDLVRCVRIEHEFGRIAIDIIESKKKLTVLFFPMFL